MNVLPDPAVMAELKSEEHVLHTASVVIQELSYGIHRFRIARSRPSPQHRPCCW